MSAGAAGSAGSSGTQTLEAPAAAEDASWTDRYHRRLLDFVNASPDVDLKDVNVVSGYEDPYQGPEGTGGGFFSIDVYWLEKEPRRGPFSAEGGPYERHAQLTNEQVARFLGSLDGPA